MEIEKLLKEAFIDLDLQAKKKEEAILALTDLFLLEGAVSDKEQYVEAVLKREAESTTGIGFGVGIPHGKSSAVAEPCLAFGRSKAGIQYDSMDGKPVHLLFLIAVPENSNNEHLKILSQLSRKLMHQEVREQLLKAEDSSMIYSIFE